VAGHSLCGCYFHTDRSKETKVNPLELSKAVGAVTDEDLRRAAEASAASRSGHRPTVLVRELAAHHRSRLLKHFLALGEEDRLLRFGQSVGDHVIEGYVDSIDFDHDTVFGVYDEDLVLIGVGHFANLRDNAQGRVAEFGVAVSQSARASAARCSSVPQCMAAIPMSARCTCTACRAMQR
jgi:hypothetical protein